MTQDPADPIEEFSTLVEILRWRAQRQPETRTYTYLTDGVSEGDHLTHASLDALARAIGAFLQSHQSNGERALLLYPAGLDFIAAFFGCLYAGVIAVPLPPPNMAQPQRSIGRLASIIRDARPRLVLTTSGILADCEKLFALSPELLNMRWVATDAIDSDLAPAWRDPNVTRASLALLQYTSGSTAEPKGVMITHGNLLHNSGYINHLFALAPDSVTVTWLPAYHDMGLTNGIIQPVFKGRRCYLMSPVSFLMRPIRWLEAISRYKATISGGPNFAYELATRGITPAQIGALDLSGWDVAYNGAEPIRAETMNRFAAVLAPSGFRRAAFHPCYGLAEATLLVSGGPLREKNFRTIRVAAFEKNRILDADADQQGVRTIVGSGHAFGDTRIVIVQPELLTVCAADEVGEIWVSGPSVTQGYWNKPAETERVCRAYLRDTGEGPFLRTGDLGFLKDGELFVTGRLKDLIIVNGRNLYPNDIELTVEKSHPSLRPASCAAFSIDTTGEEQLIIAAEVEPRYWPMGSSASNPELTGKANGRLPLDINAVVRAIRRSVAEAHDVRVHTAVLLRAGRIPKTTSGKVQRHACQASFLQGTLERIGDDVSHA